MDIFKNKKLFLYLSLIIVVIAAGIAGHLILMQQINKSLSEKKTLTDRYNKLSMMVKNSGQVLAQTKFYNFQMNKYSDILPSKALLEKDLINLKNFRENAGLTITSLNFSDVTPELAPGTPHPPPNTALDKVGTFRKIDITYSGTYFAIKNYLREAMMSYPRVVPTSISISAAATGELGGSLSLKFYSFTDNSLAAKGSGLDLPKTSYNMFSNTPLKTDVPYDKFDKNNTDFSLVLNASKSDFPTVFLTKTGDYSTALYADENKPSAVSIRVWQDKDKNYMYSFKSPMGGDLNKGIPFTPNREGNIYLSVECTLRADANDNAGVVLSISNETALPLKIMKNKETGSSRFNQILLKGVVTVEEN